MQNTGLAYYFSFLVWKRVFSFGRAIFLCVRPFLMNNRMNIQQGDPRASLFLTSEKAVFCKIPVSRSSPIALHSPKSPKTLCWDLRRCFVSNQSEFLQRCESSEVILLAKWFAREKITTRDFFNIWQHIWQDNSTEFDNTWHYSCQLKDSNWISRGIFFFCPKKIPAQKQVSSIPNNIFAQW